MTALSVPVLGETVGWRRWSAVLVGFVGVLVILRPASGLFGPPALGALFGALVRACNMLLLRRMRGIDPPEAFGIWGNGLSVIATGSVLPWLWRAPTASDLALHSFAGAIAGATILVGGGLYIFHREPVRARPGTR
jgi:drug/metabolite transporter (DMT)-like permease